MRHSGSTRTFVRVLVVGSVLMGGLTLAAGPAAAVACTGLFDANGDGFEDVPIGVPGEGIGSRNDAGMVNILLGSAGGITGTGSMTIFQEDIGANSETGDEFGAAVDIGDFNVDGCKDLVIGVPGENSDSGMVVVIYGTESGLDIAGRTILRQGLGGTSGAPEAGDRFGEVLAVKDAANASGASALAVGVPGEDIGSRVDAGMVNYYGSDLSGATPKLSTAGEAWYQGVSGIPGAAEAGDRFGAALAGGRSLSQPIIVGVPGEGIGSATNTGMVMVIGAGPSTEAYFHQDSPGVPGVNESDDRFGEAVAFGGSCFSAMSYSVVVGAPGEDIGNRVDAGSVTILDEVSKLFLYQGDGNVGGAAEAGDRFGASLLGQFPLVAGAPGEDIGSRVDAGMVSVINIECDHQQSTMSIAGTQTIHQNSAGVPGTAEAGDVFGATLGTSSVNAQDPLVLVGAPGEAIGTRANAGVVHIFPFDSSNSTDPLDLPASTLFHQNTAGVPGVSETGDRFGGSLASS